MTDAPQILLHHHLKTLRLLTFKGEYAKQAQLCAAENKDHIQYLARFGTLQLYDEHAPQSAEKPWPPWPLFTPRLTEGPYTYTPYNKTAHTYGLPTPLFLKLDIAHGGSRHAPIRDPQLPRPDTKAVRECDP